ncbi:ribonuclease HII [Candidatus Parcubacteria bacterium]|nr:MAG: ribonuclease HII [Candidatus Parcubacteria bacterium]
MNHKQTIIGIDEAGRGPLAGPVAIGAVAATGISNSCLLGREVQFPISKENQKLNFQNSKVLKGIRDSKKLTVRQREAWRKIISANFESHCVLIGHEMIDKIGIGRALLLGIEQVLAKFSIKPDLVLMDGALKAPGEYCQETIIKGDEKVPLISAASVIAKTARDEFMISLHEDYPRYGFNKNKGYGTEAHIEKIRTFGFCEVHRKSFCRNVFL